MDANISDVVGGLSVKKQTYASPPQTSGHGMVDRKLHTKTFIPFELPFLCTAHFSMLWVLSLLPVSGVQDIWEMEDYTKREFWAERRR